MRAMRFLLPGLLMAGTLLTAGTSATAAPAARGHGGPAAMSGAAVISPAETITISPAASGGGAKAFAVGSLSRVPAGGARPLGGAPRVHPNSACSSNPSDDNCDGSPVPGSGCQSGSYYVLNSLPLKNLATGQQSYSYGYVQLWWSQTCQSNWGRVVINEPGSWDIFAQIWKQNYGGYSYYYQSVPGGGAVTSPLMYAPNQSVCTNGDIFPHSGGSEAYHGYVTQYSPC